MAKPKIKRIYIEEDPEEHEKRQASHEEWFQRKRRNGWIPPDEMPEHLRSMGTNYGEYWSEHNW